MSKEENQRRVRAKTRVFYSRSGILCIGESNEIIFDGRSCLLASAHTVGVELDEEIVVAPGHLVGQPGELATHVDGLANGLASGLVRVVAANELDAVSDPC